MRQRPNRPSRLVQSVARWAITLGAAGTIVAATALYGVLFAREPVSSKHKLLLLAATLLAVAFVLAPFVRHTFSFIPRPHKQAAARTLLEEMRAGAEPELGDTAPSSTEAAEPAATSRTARLVAGVYVVFAATLLMILWALQTN